MYAKLVNLSFEQNLVEPPITNPVVCSPSFWNQYSAFGLIWDFEGFRRVLGDFRYSLGTTFSDLSRTRILPDIVGIHSSKVISLRRIFRINFVTLGGR